MLNTLDYGQVYGQAALNDGSMPSAAVLQLPDAPGRRAASAVLDGVTVPEFIDADKTQRSADTDWFKETQQNALIQSYNLNVSSGGERGGALFSLNYYDNTGTLKYTGFNRWTARLNSDYDFLGNKLKSGREPDAGEARSRPQYDLNLVRDRSTQLPSIVPVRTVDGVGWGGPVAGMSDRDNPLRLLTDNQQNRSNTGRVFGNAVCRCRNPARACTCAPASASTTASSSTTRFTRPLRRASSPNQDNRVTVNQRLLAATGCGRTR